MKKVNIDGLLALNLEEIEIVYRRLKGESVKKIAFDRDVHESTIWNQRMPQIFKLLGVKEWREVEEELERPLRSIIPSLEALGRGWPEEFRERIETLREISESLETPIPNTEPTAILASELRDQPQQQSTSETPESARRDPGQSRPDRRNWLLIAVPLLIVCLLCISGFLFVWRNNPFDRAPLSPTIPIPSDTVAPTTITVTSLPTNTALAVTETSLPTFTHTPLPLPTISPTLSVSLPFSDNFDNGINLNWKMVRGTWRTVNGRLIADVGNRSEIIVGDENWKNYIIEVDVFSNSAAGFPIGIIVRSMNGKSLMFKTDCCNSAWILIDGTSEQSIAQLSEGGLDFSLFEFEKNHIRVEVIDQVFTAYIDGRQFLQVTDSTIPNGAVGLMSQTPHENRLLFDDFSVTSP